MRITNSVLARNALHTVRDGLEGMDRAQQEVASGKRITRPSDDPAATADLLTADRRLSALGQYQRNISAATARLSAQESALSELDGLLSRARELATGQIGDTANADTRRITAEEVARLKEAAVQLANTRFGNGYLFGGDAAEQPPVTGVTLAADAVGGRVVEVAERQSIETVSDAHAIFGAIPGRDAATSGILASLDRLEVALRDNDTAAMTAAATEVNAAFDHVQVKLGETGARSQQLELAKSNAESLELGLREYRSDLGEVDLEEAVTRLLSRQNALQAALMATSRLINTSLTDYLR